MYMTIAALFILAVTAFIAYVAHYECEHTDENHGFGKKGHKKQKAGRK